MMYPLVREMTAPNAPLRVPVAVVCRVLGFSEQGYYQWRTQPISARQQEEEHLDRGGARTPRGRSRGRLPGAG